MTPFEAKKILKRIYNDPSLEDQFTEEEITEIEQISRSSS